MLYHLTIFEGLIYKTAASFSRNLPKFFLRHSLDKPYMQVVLYLSLLYDNAFSQDIRKSDFPSLPFRSLNQTSGKLCAWFLRLHGHQRIVSPAINWTHSAHSVKCQMYLCIGVNLRPMIRVNQSLCGICIQHKVRNKRNCLSESIEADVASAASVALHPR